MPDPQFSEDEYEDILIDELKTKYGPGRMHFKPSRTLENSLGYDFAVETYYDHFNRPGVFLNHHRLLGLVPPQRRAMIPGRFATALIQCKVSFLVTRRHGATAHIYDRWNSQYFRFDIDTQQNTKLSDTERVLQGQAIVRYGAPCFHSFDEIDGLAAAGLVTQRTHFQSPARLFGHSLYTYVSPLRPGTAYSSPEDCPPGFLPPEVGMLLAEARQMMFAQYVLLIWKLLQETQSYGSAVAIGATDFHAADIALGQLADLPLDPLGVLPER